MSTMRVWEIDFFRGLAILLMIIFHIIFDLWYFLELDVNFSDGPIFWIGRSAALLFMVLSGMSSVLMYKRDGEVVWRRYLVRAARVFMYALLITLVTFLLFRDHAIYFGILHFLAIGMVIAPFFVHLKWPNLALGGLAIVLGMYLEPLRSASSVFLPFGVRPFGFQTLDYYPLFPWLGAVFFGFFLANLLYREPKSRLTRKRWKIREIGEWLGRHSLVIYLVHQPIIVGVLYLFST